MNRRKSAWKIVTFRDPIDELHIGRMDSSTCDEHECWNKHRRKLIETNKQTLWYKSLKFYLFFHNYDPYAIFKTDCSRSSRLWFSRAKPEVGGSNDDSSRNLKRHMMEHLEILRLPTTQSDHMRNKCSRILRCFVAYFLIKATIISSTQYAALKHELVSRGRNPPWLSMEQVEWVALYLGNPLKVLRDSAMLLYMGPAGFCFVSLLLIPLYYERHPMNMPVLRFILNPEHELKCLDLNIKRKLDAIRVSLDVFARERLQMLLEVEAKTTSNHNRHRFLSPIDFCNVKKLLEFERWRCAQLRSYLDEFDQRLHSFRPNLFSAKYFEDSSAKMSSIIAGGHVVYIVCSTGMFMATQVLPYMDRCAMYRRELATQNRTVTVCNPFGIYTAAESVVVVELTLVLLFSCMISVLNLALFSLVSANQADLIKSIRNQLVNCRDLIYGKDSCVSGDKNRVSNKAPVNKAERLDMDKYRLETLVKLMVCETELRHNALSLSELTVHPFYYAGGTLVFLVIVGGQFRIIETQAVRSFIMIATWINVNAVAISCAHIFSRVLEFERTMWSILAARGGEVLQHNQSDGSLTSDNEAGVFEREGVGCCTFITDLWAKFVLETSLDVKSYCARPLFVKLTYEVIIELNFFVVFIYTLSVDLPRRR